MNKIILIGNLTRDPEPKQTSSGVVFCTMSIAVNRPYSPAGAEREVDFFNIVAWRGLGENCAKFLKKGNKVGVCGSLQIRTYDDKEGNKRTAVDVVADDIEFLTPKNSSDAPASSYEPAAPVKKSIKDNEPIEEDQLPF